MKHVLKGATALAALAAAAPAFAEEGWYGRIDLGYSFDGSLDASLDDPVLVDTDGDGIVDVAVDTDDFGADADFDDDWLGSIGVGYGFIGSGFRLEGEIAYRSNEVPGFDFIDPSIDPPFVDIFASDADVNAWSFMLNGYYDFNEGGAWMPYLGAGIGAASVDGSQATDVDISDDLGLITTVSSRIDDDAWAFAWQLMAGIGFQATEQLVIDVGYRYFSADGAEIDGVVFDDLTATEAFFTTDVDYDQSAILVGLRWQFALPAPPPAPYTPPPPPPPAPACQPQEYTVSIGDDLNKDAEAVIDDAAEHARECNYGEVVVTAGDERRASLVRDALIARGVPSTAIRTEVRAGADPMAVSIYVR